MGRPSVLTPWTRSIHTLSQVSSCIPILHGMMGSQIGNPLVRWRESPWLHHRLPGPSSRWWVRLEFLPVLEPETWAYLTTPDSEGYHALWTPLILYELIGNAVIGISAIVLLILMFKHHPALPACMVIYYVAALVFVVVDEIASTYIPAIGAQTDAASYRELGRSVRDVAIWVPYFLKSKRVKNTFRREGGVHVHRPQPSLPDDVPKSEPVDKPGF
jgi:hypothetical protein